MINKEHIFQFPTRAVAFPETSYSDGEDNFPPIFSHGTTCCAASFMSVKNYHTLDEIKACLDKLKAQSNSRKFSPAEREGGERQFFTVISPGEKELEKNIKQLGFKFLTNMNRRKGYPPGKLKLYMYSLD